MFLNYDKIKSLQVFSSVTEKIKGMKRCVTCSGESPEKGFTPVTEQPMIKPCRRTPRYHFGPILFSFTSLKPAFSNHSIYSSSFGKSIHTSAKKRDNQKVGCTGPIRQAFPPIFSTLYASLIPRCGSGQYSILKNSVKHYMRYFL
jgi:hypothetical protein